MSINGSCDPKPFCGIFHRTCRATLADSLLLTTPTLRPLDMCERDQVLVHVPHVSAFRSGTNSVKKPTGWKRLFEDPIPLPRGRELVTLEDAARYIQKLPKAEQQIEEWQTAVETLILVAESNGGPTMLRASASCGH